MSADSPKDRAVLAIQAAHKQLSKFAQDSYGMHGRGVTRVSVPALPAPGQTVQVATEMVYHELAELRRMTASMKDRSDAAVLIRMIETYDPAKQAVVMIAVGRDNPVSVKMRLDAPFIVED
jgi:hypothetical protein